MNFYKLRQKTTGLYFTGGRISRIPQFVEAGMRYDAIAPATASLNYCAKWNTRRGAYQDFVPGLAADDLEVVEFNEVEVAVVAKKK